MKLLNLNMQAIGIRIGTQLTEEMLQAHESNKKK